jgi:hypothetical protein
MHARLVFCLDSKLVHEGTRSLGYRQWSSGPPRARLRTRGWGHHPFPCSLPEVCSLGFQCGGVAWQIRGGPRSAQDVVMLGAPGGTVTRRSSSWVVTTQRKSRGSR